MFKMIGCTSIAWAEFLKEFPPEHVSALNAKRINVQSLYSYLALLSKFDEPAMGDVPTFDIQPWILELWSWQFWFKLPFDLVHTLTTTTKLDWLVVPQFRSDVDTGIVSGTVGAWRNVCMLRGKPYVDDRFDTLIQVVLDVFARENLSFLVKG